MSSPTSPTTNTKPNQPNREERSNPKRKSSLTSRIKSRIFHQHQTSTSTSTSSSSQPTPTTHPFLLPPPPPPHPNTNSTSKPTPKFSPTPKPRRNRHESPDEHRLRKARLELASKLQADSPQSPLLNRLDPKTGRFVVESADSGGPGFAGTMRERNQKNKRVRKRKGFVDADDIREEEGGWG